ncbi:p-loop containing nucleoside triphosphate hydrolase protein [Pleurostoma richardsiae]|uniref:P-loop containing nucleoside triphosphate hydrolase protein n=1 Tax=Pleurostoma richardsiae TaxID=41990 RepID=A0AA38RQF5_9PEZI|nr:p-loop containing nucleoside triphosphate hydrolase protein [Pleurostoma richardsiae]
MDAWMERAASGVYGAEEFVYLLWRCFFNYGSKIGSGIYEHAQSSGTALSRPKPDSDEEDIQLIVDSQDEGLECQRRCSQTTTPAVKPVQKKHYDRRREQWPITRGRRTPADIRGTNQDSNEELDRELQLRETIKSMRADLDEDDAVLDLADVAGHENIKLALEEFACFFLHFPHLTQNLRQRSTTGILLFGAQGTGKTLLVKSFAKRYNLGLYDVRASAIMSKFVGESEKFIRALFSEVRQNAPAVILLDECDGLLCNPAADAMQSHNYRLLQNELKNQWSDLIYSRDEVIVIGATNKPYDIDMDGFGRRLSLKLHVGLPDQKSCETILKMGLGRLRHDLQDHDFAVLGLMCHEKGLTGYDIDCLIEALLRRAIRNITVAEFFIHRTMGDGTTILVPCKAGIERAIKGPWTVLANCNEEISYQPFTYGDVEAAVLRARPTVDEAMMQKHVSYARQHGTDTGLEE